VITVPSAWICLIIMQSSLTISLALKIPEIKEITVKKAIRKVIAKMTKVKTGAESSLKDLQISRIRIIQLFSRQNKLNYFHNISNTLETAPSPHPIHVPIIDIM
jgi:Tfp pilus assembly major pilin PilA